MDFNKDCFILMFHVIQVTRNKNEIVVLIELLGKQIRKLTQSTENERPLISDFKYSAMYVAFYRPCRTKEFLDVERPMTQV